MVFDHSIITAKGVRKLLCISLVICLSLTLCACIEEESPETLATPALPSIVEYTISDTEYIRLLYNQTNIGEWVSGDRITPIAFDFDISYWGFLASRNGITELKVAIYELEQVNKETYLKPSGENRYSVKYSEKIATFDEGLLNSTQIQLCDTNESIPITDISVTEGHSEFFDWLYTPEWKSFTAPEENMVYEIENISLTWSATTGLGEWNTNGAVIPIRIAFDEIACFMEIYDISGEEEKIILAGNGYIDEGKFIINDFSDSMFYENSIKELVVVKNPAIPPAP